MATRPEQPSAAGELDRALAVALGGDGIDVTNSGEPDTDGKTPTNVAVRQNTVRGAQLSGLHLAFGSEDVKVSANVALDNKLDCQGESAAGAGTAWRSNTWRQDLGRTSSPAGLCASAGKVDKPKHPGRGQHAKHKHKQAKRQRPSDPCSRGLLFPRRI